MRYIIVFVLLSVSTWASGQEWSKKDSLRLDKLLSGEGEIELNNGMPLQIDFGSGVMGSPMQPIEKSWMEVDETLPTVDGQEPFDMRKVLTLHPYKADTPYNWDPVRQKKIKVGKDTWRGDQFYALTSQKIYTNWTKSIMAPGKRESIEQIEATGLRYNPLAIGANGKIAGGWEVITGPSGHDFAAVTTKEFWNRKARLRKARTLLVLSQYGDSTTVLINSPIQRITQQ